MLNEFLLWEREPQKSKIDAIGFKIGHSDQLLLNKFFDSSTTSMKKVENGEKYGGRNWKKENN